MNEKFYDLPLEKRQRMINAGYRVFSQSSYKKSPVAEIAAEAGISKSLLFYYFKNKKELYLFLWEEACRLSLVALKDAGCYVHSDLFKMMESGMEAKIRIMKEYPDLTSFVMKAFYEKDPEISQAVQKSYRSVAQKTMTPAFEKLNPEDFRPGLNLELMHKEMYWASEGYLWEAMQKGALDVEKMEADFRELLKFWRQIYTNQGEEEK